MTQLLIRLFIRNAEKTSDFRVRESYGKLAGAMGIVTNLLLCIAKLITGLLFNSISILADSVNNLSDSASSVITLIGFKLSGKPADAEHPYGHARMEYITGLIVSFIILILGVQLVSSSVDKIWNPEEMGFSILMLVVLAVSMLVKLWQSAFYKKLGKLINSTTLTATAADSLNDVMATGAVLVSAVITRFSGVNLDGWMGLVVALLIIVAGIRLIIDTSNPLLGLAPTQELVDEIYNRVMSYDGVMGLHDLNVHNYGPGRCFASVHCEVPAERDIMESHDVIDNIERDFLDQLNIHLVIHLDPIVTDDARTNVLKMQVEDLLKELSPEISMHDFRVVWGTTHSNLIFDVAVPFGFSLSDDELKAELAARVAKIDPTFRTVVVVDHSYIPRTDKN